MVQVFLDYQNVDIEDGQTVSVLLRSKFFEPEKQSRTWEIKCGKTTENNLLFREMIKQKKYTANAVVYADGVKIINGIARLIGWDNTGYSICIVETGGNTDLLADSTPIISFCRQYLENTGGLGQSDFIGRSSTLERGNMSGRWNTSDYYFGGCMSIAELVGRLRQYDINPDRWPTDAWLQSQSKLMSNYLYGAKPLQLGGWSGDIIYHSGQINKMPADVITQYGKISHNNTPYNDIKWLEFRGVDIYTNGGYKIKYKTGKNFFLAGGFTASGNYVQGFISEKLQEGSTVYFRLLTDGNDIIPTQPYVCYGASVWPSVLVQHVQIVKLHWIAMYTGNIGAYRDGKLYIENWPYNVSSLWPNCTPANLSYDDISFVAHTVQERAIEDNRGGQMYVDTSAHVSEYGQYGWSYTPLESVEPWVRGATEYDVFFSLGNLTIADIAAFCLHVIGIDLASESTASALAGEINSVEPTAWSAEVAERSAQNDNQSESAIVSVVGTDGYVFKRGNDDLKITVNINGGGTYNALWARTIKSMTIIPPSVEYNERVYVGTTEGAANAERSGSGEGVYIFTGNPAFPNFTQFTPPAFEGQTDLQNSEQTSVNISKAVRFTAKCRLTALELKKIKPNGQIHLQGTNISGMIESVEWSSNGETTIIFWQ